MPIKIRTGTDEDNIVHENDTCYVWRVPKGYEVYQNGFTHAVRVAFVGGVPNAKQRAIDIADRRHRERAIHRA